MSKVNACLVKPNHKLVFLKMEQLLPIYYVPVMPDLDIKYLWVNPNAKPTEAQIKKDVYTFDRRHRDKGIDLYVYEYKETI